MRCNELRPLLVEYILGELDTSTSTQIDEHLASGCAGCESELTALAEGAGLLYSIAPVSDLSSRREAQILERATAASKNGKHFALAIRAHEANSSNQLVLPLVERKNIGTNARGSTIFVAVLSVAAGMAAAAFIWPISGPAQRPPNALADQTDELVDASGTPNQPNATGLAAVDSLPEGLDLPAGRFQTTFISSKQKLNDLSKEGIAIFDRLTGEIHFHGREFPPAPANYQYILWLGRKGISPLPATRLDVADDGTCQGNATNPANQFDAIFITLEPSGALPLAPSSKPELVLEV